jgi:hypothetical protein
MIAGSKPAKKLGISPRIIIILDEIGTFRRVGDLTMIDLRKIVV